MTMRVVGSGISAPRPGDAGYDLKTPESFVLWPFQRKLIKIDAAVALEMYTYGQIKDRSSLAKNGVHVLGGVIDPSYRGQIGVMLINLSWSPRWFSAGQRIAQMIVLPYETPEIETVEALDKTERGTGAYGSTGR